jgi:SH3-like domain-containing protein
MQPYLNRRTLAIAAAAAVVLAVAATLFYAARSRQADDDKPPSRFVTVKADKANVRAGPGKRYPVRWVFVQPGIPVEILAEYENWRQIRDWEGQEGWMHAAMLSRKRSVIVTGEKRTLYRRADAASPPVVTLEPGIVADIEDCNVEWCRLEIRNNRGWLRRGEFWGIEPGEVIE